MWDPEPEVRDAYIKQMKLLVTVLETRYPEASGSSIEASTVPVVKRLVARYREIVEFLGTITAANGAEQVPKLVQMMEMLR